MAAFSREIYLRHTRRLCIDMTLFKKQQHAMKKTFHKREAVYVFSRIILHRCRYTVNILMAITTADSVSDI